MLLGFPLGYSFGDTVSRHGGPIFIVHGKNGSVSTFDPTSTVTVVLSNLRYWIKGDIKPRVIKPVGSMECFKVGLNVGHCLLNRF